MNNIKRPSGILIFLILAVLFPISSLFSQPIPADEEMVENFQIADVTTHMALNLLESLTKKSILRPADLPPVKLTFNSQKPVTTTQAIKILESLLALNGIAITPMGDDLLKAVPVLSIVGQVPELLESTVGLEPSQKIYTRLLRLNFLTTKQALPLMASVLTNGATNIIAIEKANAVLITNPLINLQRVEKILEKFDKQPDTKEEMRFYSLKHVAATHLKQKIDGMIQTSLKSKLEGNTAIDLDERTNQLIIYSHISNIPVIEAIINRFDVDVAPITKSEVFYIKHAEAPKIQLLIEQVITGLKNNAENNKETSATPTQGTPPAKNKPVATAPVTTDSSQNPNVQFSEFIITVADERSNSILAHGTPSDIAYLEELINKLDIQLAQVKIETIIAEVTLVKGQTRGLNAFNFDYTALGTADGTSDSYTFSDAALGGLGITTLNFGRQSSKDLAFNSIIGVASSKSNVQVLSAPTIVTTHNQEASINVSQSEPIVTGSVTDSTGTSTSSTIQFKDIGIQLKVKPLIGSNGIVQMEIEQLIENKVSEVVIDGNTQPIIGKREAKSFVTVGDGEIIIFGGLQETRPAKTESKLFILGNLPILGDKLFTRKSDTSTTRELLIFMKPTIIKDANKQASEAISESIQKEDIEYYLEHKKFSEKTEKRFMEKLKAFVTLNKESEEEPSK